MPERFLHLWAPWMFGEVMSLNAYQRSGVFHEFTCGNENHPTSVRLRATRDGWVCPEKDCEYTQNWAWPWMADWSWLEMNPWRENDRNI